MEDEELFDGNLQRVDHEILAPIFDAFINRWLTSPELFEIFYQRIDDAPDPWTEGLFYINSSIDM